MSRAVIKCGEEYVNIEAEMLIERDRYIWVYDARGEIVGVFDVARIDMAWLSKKGAGR